MYLSKGNLHLGTELCGIPGLMNMTTDPEIMGGDGKTFEILKSDIRCAPDWKDFDDISGIGDNFPIYTNIKKARPSSQVQVLVELVLVQVQVFLSVRAPLMPAARDVCSDFLSVRAPLMHELNWNIISNHGPRETT